MLSGNFNLMQKALVIFITFLSFTCFSQDLEEQIYVATETFIANKNPETFLELNKQEALFLNKVTTKDEQLALIFLLCNKAFYQKDINKQNDAITTYEKAWKRYNDFKISTISDYDIIEYCLKPLGNLYTKTNDYTNAENTIKQYIAIAKAKNNMDQEISGIINLSALYQALGKHQSVLALIEQTHQISKIKSAQKEKLQRLKATSSLALNKNLLSNDIVLPNFNVLHNKHQVAYESALRSHDYKSALKHFNLLNAYSKKDTLSVRQLAKKQLEKAQLHYLLNEKDKANTSLQLALKLLLPNHKKNSIPEPTSLYTENTFIDIFDFLARLEPDSKKALAYYDLSFYVSKLLTKNITSQQAKITNQAINRKRSESCIDLLFYSYQENSKSTYFYSALQYAEMNKASVLKDNYVKQSLLEKHPNDSLLLKEQQLLKTQELLTSNLIKKQLGYEATKNDSLNKQLLDVSIALKAVQKAIEHTYPNATSIINIEKLQEQLKTDEAILVEYFYGRQAIYQFIISEKHIDFIKIPLQETTQNSLVNFIHLFDNASAINNNIKAYTSEAFTAYNVLGIEKMSSKENLIIIPDGLLNFLPFEALLTKETLTTNFTSMPFLVTSHNVVYNSSIDFYLNNKQLPTQEKNILGIFPVFENTSQPLTYSISEAKSLEKQTKATLYMHDEATKQQFLNSVAEYNMLHLSTHATSGDFINPASIAFYDEPMLLNELYSLNIKPNLVVLSACETGVGKLQKGEGAMSIARGFQYAGAKNVLFSLWQINDASTTEIMNRFYKVFSKNHAVSYANRQSKLLYINDASISNLKKSPYYWSAFVYYGSISKPQKTSYVIYYIIGIFLVLIIVFLITRKRRKHE